MRIYVAGSSHELKAAQRLIQRVVAAGHTITHDWTFDVRQFGGNPTLPGVERRAFARTDLAAVDSADVVLFLPAIGHPSRGAHVELGYAIARRVPVRFVGRQDQYLGSIFYDLTARIDPEEIERWLADVREVGALR